jgi:3',5'-cyclic AMP phosphodiesterase CpdA
VTRGPRDPLRSILHISDIHFGPPHVAPVAAGLLELVRERAPSLVAVSGDLTQRAKPGQFTAARRFLDAMDVPVIVVPGNHDVPMYRFWERVAAPFWAYRTYFSPHLETVHRDDELFVAGINTAHNWTRKHGTVRHRRLRELRLAAATAVPGAFKVVVAHHPLVRTPHLLGEPAARRSRHAASVFAELGVELVLSGHVHLFFLGHSEDFYPHLPRHFRILHAGTTTSRRGRGSERDRNSCNWIELDAEHVTVQQLVWEATSRRFEHGQGAAWSRTEAESV